ncbi:GNAT family N-acetyltransferase [Candidatus Saganbacteria bacterium]|nr:GNAT family N-acetyltransferase [Candidatus Saganbacteria bacterium]
MAKVRKATPNDKETIDKILKELDIYFFAQEYNDFHIAEKDGAVAGVAKLTKYGDILFLSSVGAATGFQGQGIATELLNELFKNAQLPIYLYTVIPDFFKKFGFIETPPIPSLPKKNLLECNECFPGKCACMVRAPG